MVLQGVLWRISVLAARTYYRFETTERGVPAKGPVLIVANHPNSLLDPALVAAAAGRPVRFLAKAPLFSDPAVGWLVRAAGSIPVYRRRDDPSAVGRNDEMFRAVHAALGAGAAVGIFPEGLSHSEPSLAPLRTGAARIALGAAPSAGGAFPVVPVGLCYREKDRFRSEALAWVGAPVDWDDLAHAGADDAAAVRELTGRIDAALRGVTLNLERWEDAPLIEWAEAIHAAEWTDAIGPSARAGEGEGSGAGRAATARAGRHRGHVRPETRVQRLGSAGRALAALRRADDMAWVSVARDVQRHARLLEALRLESADLRHEPRVPAAVRWVVRRFAYFLVAGPVGLAGAALFFLPYRATARIEARIGPELDRRSTYKALYGALLHLLWIGLLAGTAAALRGWPAGLLALIALPPLALASVVIRDRWHDTRAEARRFLLLRGRRSLHARLRARQREIAERLEALRRAGEGIPAGAACGSNAVADDAGAHDATGAAGATMARGSAASSRGGPS